MNRLIPYSTNRQVLDRLPRRYNVLEDLRDLIESRDDLIANTASISMRRIVDPVRSGESEGGEGQPHSAITKQMRNTLTRFGIRCGQCNSSSGQTPSFCQINLEENMERK